MNSFSVPSQTFIYDLIVGLEADGEFCNHVFYYKKRMLEAERPFPKVISSSEVAKRCLSWWDRSTLVHSKEEIRAKALLDYIEEQQIALLHCHFIWVIWGCLQGIIDRIPESIPIVVSAHGTDVTDAIGNGIKLDSIRAVLSRKNMVFTGSTAYMRDLLGQVGVPEARFRMLPNAVNSRFFSERKKHFFQTGEKFKCITNGRLVAWKGHEYLIKAVAEFRKQVYINVELTILGDGQFKPYLQGLVNELGLANVVRFIGTVPHADIPGVLAEHDVYVQPSIVDKGTRQTESFGVAVLEAIAVGLPVIVSDVGGLPYVIGEQNKFATLVSPGDVAALRSALAQVFASISDNTPYAKDRVAEYSPAKQLESCKSIYRGVLIE